MSKKVAATISVALLAVAMSGCQMEQEKNIEVANAWVKAVDGGMTGMFAELSHSAGNDVALVGGSSPIADVVEVHEVENGVMKEKPEGVVIPVGETSTLMPGGDHLMLMGLTGALLAGETIPVTLFFDSGQELTLEVMVKEFSGANEDYQPSRESGGE
ncbi:MAG: copper chaperone PCu(A)C [Pontimonas sp.]